MQSGSEHKKLWSYRICSCSCTECADVQRSLQHESFYGNDATSIFSLKTHWAVIVCLCLCVRILFESSFIIIWDAVKR